MQTLSMATANDFEILLNRAEALRGFATAEEAAQAGHLGLHKAIGDGGEAAGERGRWAMS